MAKKTSWYRSVQKRLVVRRLVEPEVPERHIEIAFQAPTGSNGQSWHFVVLTTHPNLLQDSRDCDAGFFLPSKQLRKGNAQTIFS